MPLRLFGEEDVSAVLLLATDPLKVLLIELVAEFGKSHLPLSGEFGYFDIVSGRLVAALAVVGVVLTQERP